MSAARSSPPHAPHQIGGSKGGEDIRALNATLLFLQRPLLSDEDGSHSQLRREKRDRSPGTTGSSQMSSKEGSGPDPLPSEAAEKSSTGGSDGGSSSSSVTLASSTSCCLTSPAGSAGVGSTDKQREKARVSRTSLILWHTHQSDAAAVRKLLEEDPSLVAARDYDSRTPLHVASLHGWMEVARCLLEYGADVNAQDRWKNTVIYPLLLSLSSVRPSAV